MSRHRLGLRNVELDILGRAYEYLLRLLETHGVEENGQAITPTTFAMARMNAVTHDIETDIRLGDTMRHPAFEDEEEGLSVIITSDEAARNDYNLSPSRYVATNEQEDALPLEEAVVRLREAEEERPEADRRLAEILQVLEVGKYERVRTETPSSSFHPFEGVRLHTAGRVFRHHLHAPARPFVRARGGWKHGVERMGADCAG